MFNDGEFTKEDWDGIRSAGFSQKKEKVDKVGRFGIGFSSVYHLTGLLIFGICPRAILRFWFCSNFSPIDCPWILSGTKLLMMDPTLQHLDRHTRMWDFTNDDHMKDWEGWPDMRAPWTRMLNFLGLPNLFKGEHIAGTLFRLPLRNKASPIQQASGNLYSCR